MTQPVRLIAPGAIGAALLVVADLFEKTLVKKL